MLVIFWKIRYYSKIKLFPVFKSKKLLSEITKNKQSVNKCFFEFLNVSTVLLMFLNVIAC